jgi:hypothetical protein
VDQPHGNPPKDERHPLRPELLGDQKQSERGGVGRATGADRGLKTPEYSGLGVYNPDPRSLAPPTDFGLAASNKNLLKAASDIGVKYLHGNMSFTSHRPRCFNCGIYHPLQPDLFIVPDWPTNIGYQTTTPDEQTLFYNSLYGPQGRWPYHDRNLTYTELLRYEADMALQHVMSGSAYVHTLHQGNLHQYTGGKSLTFDWIQAVVAAYSTYYRVPLKNPDWLTLAAYVQARNAHFAELATTQDPVWNRVTNAINYTPTTTGSLFLTGVETRPATPQDDTNPDESENYGSDSVSRLSLAKGASVVLIASPRS